MAVIPSLGSRRYVPGPNIAVSSVLACWGHNYTIQDPSSTIPNPVALLQSLNLCREQFPASRDKEILHNLSERCVTGIPAELGMLGHVSLGYAGKARRAFVPHMGQIIAYKSQIWDSCGSGWHAKYDGDAERHTGISRGSWGFPNPPSIGS